MYSGEVSKELLRIATNFTAQKPTKAVVADARNSRTLNLSLSLWMAPFHSAPGRAFIDQMSLCGLRWTILALPGSTKLVIETETSSETSYHT